MTDKKVANIIKFHTQSIQKLTETATLKQPALVLNREGLKQSTGSTQVWLLGKRAHDSIKVVHILPLTFFGRWKALSSWE